MVSGQTIVWLVKGVNYVFSFRCNKYPLLCFLNTSIINILTLNKKHACPFCEWQLICVLLVFLSFYQFFLILKVEKATFNVFFLILYIALKCQFIIVTVVKPLRFDFWFDWGNQRLKISMSAYNIMMASQSRHSRCLPQPWHLVKLFINLLILITMYCCTFRYRYCLYFGEIFKK